MSVAIYYSSVQTADFAASKVFGLQVAVQGWLHAYLRFGSAEKIQFLVGEAFEWNEINALAHQAGIDPQRLVALDRRFPQQNFPQLTTIFRPEPDTRNLFWQRQQSGDFAFCGLAHAISGVEAGQVLQEYIMAPSEIGDAIICPSQAVASAIRAFWDHYSDYLNRRFGVAYRCAVDLPVIPLGIDIEKFAAKMTSDKRSSQRQALGIDAADTVLLWVGRLSAAIKAHPLAMFQAAETAALRTGAALHLVMLGYFVPSEAEAPFRQLTAEFCPHVRMHFIASDDALFPDGLWAAGDIFLSLVDNYQESFGLTPIEAMAAGLPRVISDWDGYRDSVSDGEDGFLIRTTQPPPGQGFALTEEVLSGRQIYGGFLAQSALTVAVDVAQAADRLARLIGDTGLRKRISEKARRRVETVYDWRHIIPVYENLWAEQAARRRAQPPAKKNWASALPQLPDPYSMYKTYPTACLAESDNIRLAVDLDEIEKRCRSGLNTYNMPVLVEAGLMAELLAWLGRAGEVTIASLLQRFAQDDPARLWRTLAWLQKLGIIENSACQTGSAS